MLRRATGRLPNPIALRRGKDRLRKPYMLRRATARLRNRRHAVRFCLCSGRLQAGRLSPLRLLRMQRSVFESASFLEGSVLESASFLEDPPKEGRQIPLSSRRALLASRMTVREGISLAPAFIVAVAQTKRGDSEIIRLHKPLASSFKRPEKTPQARSLALSPHVMPCWIWRRVK
jgi:hypothetical protein